ncbi:hypothetical protein J5N97_004086 [Dioscorea zingiberensis]|uniref:Uncharacterized protein n=1 Tax=Dioscorea zingiberensis TaxID=325984 RepID=A0A9D5D5E1_9LILI|nr:hypothetical protein J5N97_004086 [Dioscorea zingiberensis]
MCRESAGWVRVIHVALEMEKGARSARAPDFCPNCHCNTSRPVFWSRFPCFRPAPARSPAVFPVLLHDLQQCLQPADIQSTRPVQEKQEAQQGERVYCFSLRDAKRKQGKDKSGSSGGPNQT